MIISEIKEALERIQSYIEAARGYVIAEEDEDEVAQCRLKKIKYNLCESLVEIQKFTLEIDQALGIEAGDVDLDRNI